MPTEDEGYEDGTWYPYEDDLEKIKIIMDKEEAREALAAFGNDTVALDFETTSLDPNYGHVRLSCTYHPKWGIQLFDHHFCGTFKELVPLMMEPLWAVYNAKFEVRWFDYFLPNEVDLIDVDFLSKAKLGGNPSSLAKMAKRDLGVIMDKTERLSDWSIDLLGPAQIRYAGLDAVVTWKLFEHWRDELNEEQRDAAFIFQDAVRATVECEDTGLVLDVAAHSKNIETWKRKQAISLRRVRNWTNEATLPNPGSDKQVSDLLLTQLGDETKLSWPKTNGSTPEAVRLSLRRQKIEPIAAKSPYPFSRWLNALLRFRYYRKYLSTYGETLITKQYLEDRITYRLNIAQAATGRYSSSSINIQNIPRAPWVRAAFLPPDGYDELTVADYSGIEIRVLAELSQDPTLLQDAIYGDVHSGSAAAIFKIDADEFLEIINEEVEEGGQHSPLYYEYKEKRSRGKGFTFQNTYGAGAGALSIALKCSVSEAEEALGAWAARYPRAYNYRYIMFDAMMQGGFLPVCDGRTIYVYKSDRSIPVASNYGIQGAAASVMYRAMYHVRELRDQLSKPSLIRLSATVHDELLLANKREHRDAAHHILVEGMKRGWLDIFPDTSTDNLIEAKSGPNWGAAK